MCLINHFNKWLNDTKDCVSFYSCVYIVYIGKLVQSHMLPQFMKWLTFLSGVNPEVESD